MPKDIARTKATTPEVTSSGLDEFAPKRERVTKEVTTPDFIKPGWAVGTRSSNSAQIPVFKVENDDDEVLIKFLEEAPFAPIFQHWVLVEGKRRAFTCITPANDCPLCARGDKPKSSDWFNVIDLSGDAPELKVWYASPDPATAIKARADNKRTSPINKDGLYFVVSKSKGKNGIAAYSLDPVKEDELDTWGASALTDQQLEVFNGQKFDATIVKVQTKLELAEIARQHLTDE